MTTSIRTAKTRKFTGEVVSNRMQKTLVVEVARTKVHPVYKKRYTVTRRFHVHDEHGKHNVGDMVSFQECRPLSKLKRWRVISE